MTTSHSAGDRQGCGGKRAGRREDSISARVGKQQQLVCAVQSRGSREDGQQGLALYAGPGQQRPPKVLNRAVVTFYKVHSSWEGREAGTP